MKDINTYKKLRWIFLRLNSIKDEKNYIIIYFKKLFYN
jgi:hypothetical protein